MEEVNQKLEEALSIVETAEKNSYVAELAKMERGVFHNIEEIYQVKNCDLSSLYVLWTDDCIDEDYIFIIFLDADSNQKHTASYNREFI